MNPNQPEDPFRRIKGAPGPGLAWTLMEHLEDEPPSSGFQVCRVYGKGPETPNEKKARLFREAAELIRKGTRPHESLRSPLLREGLIRVAEALETETE